MVTLLGWEVWIVSWQDYRMARIDRIKGRTFARRLSLLSILLIRDIL